MKFMIKTMVITAAMLSLLNISKAHAQDFYNGMVGPKATQIDMYANRSDGQNSYMVIPKVFGPNFSKIPLMIAAPTAVSKEGIDNKGVNIGAVANDLFGWNAIGAVALFKDENRNYNQIIPNAYATKEYGKTTVDLEANTNKNFEGMLAATLGYGINDRLRVGGSVTAATGKTPKYHGLARLEITKDHQYWAELQTNLKEKQYKVRLAANF